MADVWLAFLLDFCDCHLKIFRELNGKCSTTYFSVYKLNEDEYVEPCDYCDRPKNAIIIASKFCRCGKKYEKRVPDLAPHTIKILADKTTYYPCNGDCYGREKRLRPLNTETITKGIRKMLSKSKKNYQVDTYINGVKIETEPDVTIL